MVRKRSALTNRDNRDLVSELGFAAGYISTGYKQCKQKTFVYGDTVNERQKQNDMSQMGSDRRTNQAIV